MDGVSSSYKTVSLLVLQQLKIVIKISATENNFFIMVSFETDHFLLIALLKLRI